MIAITIRRTKSMPIISCLPEIAQTIAVIRAIHVCLDLDYMVDGFGCFDLDLSVKFCLVTRWRYEGLRLPQ